MYAEAAFSTRFQCHLLKNGYYTIAFSANSDIEGEFWADADAEEEFQGIYGECQLSDIIKYIDFDVLIILTETIQNPSFAHWIAKVGKNKNIPVFSVDGVIEGCYNMIMDYHDGFERIVRHIVEDHG